MAITLNSRKGCAVVGLSGNETGQGLLSTAVTLAHRFNIELHLVSVVEPIPFDLIAFDSPAYLAYPPVNLEIEAQRVKEREEALADIIKKLSHNHGVAATGSVRSGSAAANLISEAVSRHANLLLSGYDSEAFRTGASGFTTTLTLMHDAPLPVLAVPHAMPLDFSKQNFRILLADDLLDGTQEAARKAYELASSLPGSHIRHVHVYGDLQEKIRSTWQTIVNRSGIHTGEILITNEDEAIALEFKARKDRLSRQAYPFTQLAEKRDVKVEYDLRSGNVDAELQVALKDCNPDIAVFGRHHFLHTRPLLIGRVPFRAMLHAGCGVLTVPPSGDLYAAVPFPAAHF